MSITRREFLEATAAGTLAAGSAAGAEKIPTRVLGKTGARVSMLAYGGGSRFTAMEDEEQAVQSVKHALELGFTYIDTSDDYGRAQESEIRIGKALKAHGRKGIFLATKCSNRDASKTRALVERSLKNLQVDQLDLLHIHALTGEDDLAAIEAKGGVLEQVIKCKEAKLTRFIGITCHAAPVALQKALERHDFDCTQMALNAAMAAIKNGRPGMVPNPDVKEAFEETALPVAVRKKMGIIAMKVFAQDALKEQPEATGRNMIYYALSLPITTAVIGYPRLELLDENVKLAKEFKPLPKAEMRRLAQALSVRNKTALMEHFRHHTDA
jgi:predicted aldo/keto reductase-like oxidoreductase